MVKRMAMISTGVHEDKNRSAVKVDFIGVASSRSGSTWLAECLREHPQIDLPVGSDGSEPLGTENLREGKELDFFSVGDYCVSARSTWRRSTYINGLAWYLDQFPASRPGRIRGEFSPDYHCYSKSAETIRRTFPDAKIIMILRNPVDSLDSVRRFMVAGRHLPIETLEDDDLMDPYLDLKLYARTLKQFFDEFPRANIKVILYEDMTENPADVVADVYRFLGVADDFVPLALRRRINAAPRIRSWRFKKIAESIYSLIARLKLAGLARFLLKNRAVKEAYNSLNHVRGEPLRIASKTRARWQAYYRDDILELQGMIVRDLSAWLG